MKTWSPHWQDPGRATLIREDVWFAMHEPLLLKMAQTDFGRDLLCLRKDLPVVRMRPDSVTFYQGRENGKYVYLSDFRTKAKWANVIRTRWSEFNSFARYFQSRDLGVTLSPLARYARSVSAAVTTLYPNPHPETNSVDGEPARVGVTESLATIRAGAGNQVNDDNATGWVYYNGKAAGSYTDMYRGIHGFRTEPIDNADTVSAWTFSLVGSTGVSPSNTIGASVAQANICVVLATLGSNSALANSDFQGVGSSLVASRFAYASWVNDNSTYNAIAGTDMSAISLTGTTNLACRSGIDFDNSDPAGNGALMLYCRKAESSGTTTDPKLEVTHAAAAAAFTPIILSF